MTNVVEMPRRETWVATLIWPLPEALRALGPSPGAAFAMVNSLVREGGSWIVDCDPSRDVVYADGVLTTRFEVTDAFAESLLQDASRVEGILGSVMPDAKLSVQRDVWVRSAPPPKLDHERWHPRCVALLDVLADSEHPEADAERYATLEMLRNIVRKVV